jgi:ADP-heptose:LPS heptosyltransferase
MANDRSTAAGIRGSANDRPSCTVPALVQPSEIRKPPPLLSLARFGWRMEAGTRSWVRARPLRSSDFPNGTPLRHFFAWNEAARQRDRRYTVACDLYRLITTFGDTPIVRQAAVAHLCSRPVVIARSGDHILIPNAPYAKASDCPDVISEPALEAAKQTVKTLMASVGSADIGLQAGFFVVFERLANEIDLDALARRRPRVEPSQRRPSPRRILILRLSALGDFVQALGPAAAIRRYHQEDHITLLTTAPFAAFARQLGFFDHVMVDRRPAPFDINGWLALRRHLRNGRFDRVYDLQTSQRSAGYARLFRPGPMPEWSGIAAKCSHPHANFARDRQHTIDKQAEQLLMAGIHPTSLPALPPIAVALPQNLAGRPFVLLVPGASSRHPAKRWPASRYGLLARALLNRGYVPVVIGSNAEQALAAAIHEICPQSIDLVGRTDLLSVAGLAERAVLTIGNDTGVTHLAAAAGCPIIVLFSAASDPAWCAPRGLVVRVLTTPDLEALEVDRVLAEAVAIIDRPAMLQESEPASDICDENGVRT